jgi:erythromycin esterase
MARNVQWILNHAAKGAKIVLWAHNSHVARQPYFGNKRPMGVCLDEWYGKAQVVIGFGAGGGQYTALTKDRDLRSDNPLQEPVEDSYEAYFRASGVPVFMLDLRRAAQGDPGSGWLRGALALRSIGAETMDEQFMHHTDLSELFDVVTYLDRTTASRLLPGAWESTGKK